MAAHGRVLGDRRKILRAIASLKSTETAAPKLATDAEIARPQDTAERRDPEDLREVISAYQKCVAETVQRFGGFVAKYMGDDSTRKLVGSLFELEDLGAQDLATGRERRYQHVCLGALSSQASQKRAGIVQIGCIKTLCELIVD